jgi:hypothetical protein
MYWLLGRKSQLSLGNKLLLYKSILKPIWTYGNQLRRIVDQQWYVPNTLIRRDLQIPSVKEEISHYSSHYNARITAHPNDILLTNLEQPECKRLQRHLPIYLPTRFMV